MVSRKQREIESRHELILEKARQLFIAKGYHSVTMDMIAKEMEYSKGTIYQHFTSKECIIMTLCTQFCTLMYNLISSITENVELNPRLQLILIQEAFILVQNNCPDDVQLKILADSQPFSIKVPPELKMESALLEQKTFNKVVSIVNKAIENKQLKLKSNITAEFIALGGWGLAHGIYTLTQNSCAVSIPLAPAEQLLRVNSQLYLDGVGWDTYTITEKRQLFITEYLEQLKSIISNFYPATLNAVGEH